MASKIRAKSAPRGFRKAVMERQRSTTLIPPPAVEITPEIAARWLCRTYPKLAEFARVRDFADYIIRRSRDREDAARAMRALAGDLIRIVTVCGQVLATGKSIRMQHAPLSAFDSPRTLTGLRAALRFAKWDRENAEKHGYLQQHAGVQPILERALRVWERKRRRLRGANLREAA